MNITGVGSQTGYGIHSDGQVQASQRPPGDLEAMTQRLIQDKDEDGNGTLNAFEICISDAAFQKADANRDGELDSNELMNSARDIGRELGPPPGMPMMENLEEMTERLIQNKDQDANGTLSLTELGISEETFEKADANGDGELNSDELSNSAQEIGRELGPPPRMPRFRPDDDDEDDENARLQALLDLLGQDDDEATQTTIF